MARFNIPKDMVQRVLLLSLCYCLITLEYASASTTAPTSSSIKATSNSSPIKDTSSSVTITKRNDNNDQIMLETSVEEQTKDQGDSQTNSNANNDDDEEEEIEIELERQPMYRIPARFYNKFRHASYEPEVSAAIQRQRYTVAPNDYDSSRVKGQYRQGDNDVIYSQANDEGIEDAQLQAPKNYAFAYAVNDGASGEDFHHKEEKQGNLTVGEYKVQLPDGRVQVVRYTAGEKQGYKADVSYLGEADSQNSQSQAQISKPPVVVIRRRKRPKNGRRLKQQYQNAQHQQQAIHNGITTTDSSPVYLSTPLKYQSPYAHLPPSLSPSAVYGNHAGSTGVLNPNVVFKSGPSSTPQPIKVYKPSPPTVTTYFTTSSPQPNSIYDKMPHQQQHHQQIITGHGNNQQQLIYSRPQGLAGHAQSPRAGPLSFRASPTEASFPISSSVRPPLHQSNQIYDIQPAYVKQQKGYFFHQGASPTPQYSTPYTKSPIANGITLGQLHQNLPIKIRPGVYSTTTKSKLIPIEFFKAGPATAPSNLAATQAESPNTHNQIVEHHGPPQFRYPQRLKNHGRFPPPQKHNFKPHSPPKMKYQQYHVPFSSYEDTSPSPLPIHIMNTMQPAHYQFPAPPQQHYQQQQYRPQMSHPGFHMATHLLPSHNNNYFHPGIKSYGGPKQPLYIKQQQHEQQYLHKAPQPQHYQQSNFGQQINGPVYSNSLQHHQPSQIPPLQYQQAERPPTVVNHKSPKTTTHPYVVGAADYGKSVGYSTGDTNEHTEKPFIPSEQIPNSLVSHHFPQDHPQEHPHNRHFRRLPPHPDHLESFMREYLFDNSPDSIVGAHVIAEHINSHMDPHMSNAEQASEYAFSNFQG